MHIMRTEDDFPKIGLVVVGGIGRAILDDLHGRLPPFSRIIAINTDADSLQRVKADHKVQVGDGKTLPRQPLAAQLLAQTTIPQIMEAVAGLDIALIAVGMGGAAGSGISPVVAQVLRQKNILTLVFATSPFSFEGTRRHQNALSGVRELSVQADALLPVSNSELEQVVHKNATLESVMMHAPLAFVQLCRCITNAVHMQGCNIGIEYMDLRHILFEQTGDCAFGFGSASGLCGAEAAAQQAIDHLFLGQRRLQRATAALVSIEAAPNALYLRDTKNIMTMIRSRLPAKACIGYSTVSSRPDDQHDFRVSIFASGIL